MESYLLVNKQVVQFLGATHEMKGAVGFRRNEKDAKVNFVPCNHTAASKALSESILKLGNTDKMLAVQVTLFKAVSSIGPTHGAGYTKIEAKGENHILHKIWCMAHGNVKVNLKVSDFGVMNDQGNVITDGSTGWEFEGNELYPSRCLLPNNDDDPFHVELIYTSLFAFQNIPVAMIDCWKNRQSFIGTFSISIALEGLSLSRQLAVENELTLKCQKMLHEKIETDLHLVSKERKLVKCHRAMLAVSSEILSRKLKRQNGQLEVDFMQHLSLECIQAVLSYMYYGDVSEVTTSVKFAIEILQAAIDFRLVKLISHVQQYLVLKPQQEFLVRDAVKLFLILKSSSVENYSNHSSDEDGSSDNDNESEEGEDENESHEDEPNEDDDSEAQSNRDVNGPQRTGKGIRLSACTRKRAYQNGHGNIVKKARNQIDDNLAGTSGTSAGMNGNGVPHPGTSGVNGENGNGPVEDTADDNLHYRNLLEKQAIDVILWYRNSSPNSLKEAVKYHQLVKFPEVLLEIFNLTIQPLQQMQVANVLIIR